MAKNLDVALYRNGDIIPQVIDSPQWANLTTGAWCYNNNDSSNNATYVKLYNWYAVNDVRGLAPLGWHIPGTEEWSGLTYFLGGDSLAGGKMKATTLWNSPNTGASNKSGFTGFPGGYRKNMVHLTLVVQAVTGGFLTNMISGVEGSLSFDYLACYMYHYNKRYGMSVRCIKD